MIIDEEGHQKVPGCLTSSVRASEEFPIKLYLSVGQDKLVASRMGSSHHNQHPQPVFMVEFNPSPSPL